MAAPYSFKRVLVYVKKTNNVLPTLANFSESVVNYFSSKENDDEVVVNAELHGDKLILSPWLSSTSELHYIKLKRPSFCPFHNLQKDQTCQIPTETQQRGVDVGVCIILETSDGKVLLTRRSDHMRTFPRVWVTPGGHIEIDEMPKDTAFRELREECGLDIMSEMCYGNNTTLLALWESTFPTKLSRGLPRRHHIVAYFLAKLLDPYTSEYLTKHIRLDPGEVSACTWLSREEVVHIVEKANEETRLSEVTECDGAQMFNAITVNESGKMIRQQLPFSVLTATCPDDVPVVERVSTGTKYAFSEWLNHS